MMPSPPPGLKNSRLYFALSFFHQGQNLFHRLLKRFHRGELRANVHLHAAQPDVFQFARARINRFDVLELDAELVLVSAGRDFGMRLGRDVRIDAHGDGRALF